MENIMSADNRSVVKSSVQGVIIGLVTAVDEDGAPSVAYPGNVQSLPLKAKTVISLDSDAIGKEVALMFEQGDISSPMVMGLLHKTAEKSPVELTPDTLAVSMDTPSELTVAGKRIELTGQEEIVLKCGQSSITMTRSGKILIRGKYISTRSAGAHRIKGGSVQIN